MKITKTQLKRIIKEELGRVLSEEIPKSMVHSDQKGDDLTRMKPLHVWGVALYKVLRDSNAFRPERGLPQEDVQANVQGQLETMLSGMETRPRATLIQRALKAGQGDARGGRGAFGIPDGFGDYVVVETTDGVFWINEKHPGLR